MRINWIPIILAAVIIFTALSIANSEGFRQYPDGKRVEVTFDHELGFERDTVLARSWIQSGNKWYVMCIDSTDIWCDNVKELSK